MHNNWNENSRNNDDKLVYSAPKSDRQSSHCQSNIEPHSYLYCFSCWVADCITFLNFHSSLETRWLYMKDSVDWPCDQHLIWSVSTLWSSVRFSWSGHSACRLDSHEVSWNTVWPLHCLELRKIAWKIGLIVAVFWREMVWVFGLCQNAENWYCTPNLQFWWQPFLCRLLVLNGGSLSPAHQDIIHDHHPDSFCSHSIKMPVIDTKHIGLELSILMLGSYFHL